MPSALFAQNSAPAPGVVGGAFGSGVVVGPGVVVGSGVVVGIIVSPGSPQTERKVQFEYRNIQSYGILLEILGPPNPVLSTLIGATFQNLQRKAEGDLSESSYLRPFTWRCPRIELNHQLDYT